MEENAAIGRKLGQNLLLLEPQYRERVWGGTRLRPADPRIGEAWIAFGESVVGGGPHAGETLADLAGTWPKELLGADVAGRFGTRFPLLIKFLDASDWLSVQVHPNDEQAARLVGPGEPGKTEAWYFLDAAAGARILAGVKPGTETTELAAAIRDGRVLDVAQEVAVNSGEAILIPAGTLHAIGPGLLIYEIQQQSDTTYRAYDWGRPQTAGRKLHIEESVEVARVVGPSRLVAARSNSAGPGSRPVLSCDYFDLVEETVGSDPIGGDTGGRSLHIITAVEGTAEIRCRDDRVFLEPFASAVVAGAAGAYEIRATNGPARLLRASVPATTATA